jgi:glycosyltransferase involved in cell wall biosynthesis
MANGLLNRGHQVRILYRHYKPANIRDRLRLIRNWLLLYDNKQDWISKFRGGSEGFKDIETCSFDTEEIIIASGIECYAELDRLSGNSNIKIQYIRGLTPWMPAVMDKALSMKLPKIAISTSNAEGIRSFRSGEVLSVIPNGVDTGDYYPSVDEKERNGIGTIYSGHPAKDPGTVLEVLRRIRKRFPNIPQYVFGKYPRPAKIPRKDYMNSPSVDKARDIYSRSLVWIMASRSEGFGLPILEAMACGCAVIATDCGGPRDIIVDGENGFLVKVGDIEQIVQRVERLLNDHVLRERFVRKSQETVKKFTWDNSVNKLEKLLLKISEKQ